MAQSLSACQRLDVCSSLLLDVSTRLLLHLPQPLHQRGAGVSRCVRPGVVAGGEHHAARLLLLQRHLCAVHCVSMRHALCLLQPWVLRELSRGANLRSEQSSLVHRLALLERSCLCLLPEQPLLLLLLLLLQEFHLEQLLLRCDCMDRGGLHHGARASLQHVRQGLFRISWNKGACWIQSGTTWWEGLVLHKETRLLWLSHDVVTPQGRLRMVHHLRGNR